MIDYSLCIYKALGLMNNIVHVYSHTYARARAHTHREGGVGHTDNKPLNDKFTIYSDTNVPSRFN